MKLTQRARTIFWRIYPPGRILITGCGRSGTHYIAQALTLMGLPFSHEEPPKMGIASWELAVDTTGPAIWGDFRPDDYRFTVILHQVRHPLNAIASIMSLSPLSWAYIALFIPLERSDSILSKSMKCWYEWNLKAERKSQWTYRIEELPNIFDEFCRRIGHPELAKKLHVLQQVPKNFHSVASGPPLTWELLDQEDAALSCRIKDLAKRYGYRIEAGSDDSGDTR